MARETRRGRAISRAKTRHGQKRRGAETPEYRTWCSIIRRCHNPNASGYENYGARGTRVCDEWRASFESFFNHMGTRPDGHSIDRIDSSGDYAPGNCRWATMRQQQRNRSSNRMIDFDGRRQCMTDWAEEVGLRVHTLRRRLELGWDVERALHAPLQNQRRAHLSPEGLHQIVRDAEASEEQER